MRRSPWALALLALSLPAPALSDPLPLHRHRIADPGWYGDPYDANVSWQSQRPLPDDGLDDWSRLRWRDRTAYGPLNSPSDGYRLPRAGGEGYRYGYLPGRRAPLAVVPVTPQPAPRCGPGPALVGAAIGGGLGAALSDGSRQRQWALPIGATVGGLLGGVLAGC